MKKRRMRWCSACYHAVNEHEMVRRETGLPVCPHCGAGEFSLLLWDFFREQHEDWPLVAKSGAVYLP